MKIVGVEESSSDINCFNGDGVEVESDLKIKHKIVDGRNCLKRKSIASSVGCIKQVSGCYKQPPLKTLSPEIFKDESLTIGGQVKARGEVLKRRDEARCRPPNTTCRVETFGRICQTFDDRKTRWVVEMGFGGLLHFAGDMHLPRQLSYWLMTCIDPLNYTFRTSDGRVIGLSKNQVHWVLGIPNRGRSVPGYKSITDDNMIKIHEIMGRYGKAWSSKSNKTGRQYKSQGIPVDRKLMERVEGYWGEEEGDEFKMLFLLLSLELLCPTQSSRLASDLVPSLTCAPLASEYDWCSLVLKKLMDSVATFARRFYASGYASGCGGCLIFAVVFYLDRLDRQPVSWGVFPRIQAWTMNEIRFAVKEDRMPDGGDFGVVVYKFMQFYFSYIVKKCFRVSGIFLQSLDVAYGESHPLLARDTQGPEFELQVNLVAFGRARKRKMPTPRRVAMRKNLRQYRMLDDEIECVFCHSLSSCRTMNASEVNRCQGTRVLEIVVLIHDCIKRSLCDDAVTACEMVHLIAGNQSLFDRQHVNHALQRRGIVIFTRGVGIRSLCTDTLRKLIESGCCVAMVLVSHVIEAGIDRNGTKMARLAVFLKLRSVLQLYNTQSQSLFVFVKKRILNFDHLCVELGLRSHKRDPRDVMMVLTVCHH